MDSSFAFSIFQPQGQLSPYVQAVWSASVPQGAEPVRRWLHGDAGSGILFNLGGEIFLGDQRFSSGVVLQPVSKQAQCISLPPGSQLAGLRFHPAIGFGVLGKHVDKPTLLAPENNAPLAWHSLYRQLSARAGNRARMVALYRWLGMSIDFSGVAPMPLLQALNAVQSNRAPGRLEDDVALSQRQLERQFRLWLGMTPKYYQRLFRVNKTLNFLKCYPDTDLAELALDNGFADQAHMTREFRQFARITPKRYSKLRACRV